MAHHQPAMRPRQIYTSTATRRERRWVRARSRGPRGIMLVTILTVVAAFAVLATFTPGLS